MPRMGAADNAVFEGEVYDGRPVTAVVILESEQTRR